MSAIKNSEILHTREEVLRTKFGGNSFTVKQAALALRNSYPAAYSTLRGLSLCGKVSSDGAKKKARYSFQAMHTPMRSGTKISLLLELDGITGEVKGLAESGDKLLDTTSKARIEELENENARLRGQLAAIRTAVAT